MNKSLPLLASLLLLSQLALAEDWPKWRGADGSGISHETGLLDKWPDDGPKQVWTADVGRGYASPVAAAGKVYFFCSDGKNDNLTAYDAKTGKVIWTQGIETGYTGQYPGSRASADIEGDQIFTYGADGKLACRQLADGKLLWACEILTQSNTHNIQWGMSSNPVVTADRVYVQAGSGGPIAVAVDRATGKVAWKSQAQGSGAYAAPVMADIAGKKQLLVFGGPGLVGIDPATGQTLWIYPWTTKYDINAASPIVKGDMIFITSAYDHGSAMLQIVEGKPKLVWENKDIQARFQPPILEGDVMYVASEAKAVGVGTILCVNWADGTIKWKASPSELRINFGGSMVRFGDKLITLSDHGKATLMLATPEKYEKISQFKAVEGSEVWSSPMIYDGKLYVKGESQLACFDISAK